MQEEHNIGIEIRARIASVIGAQELEEDLRNVTERVKSSAKSFQQDIQSMIDNPEVTGNLSPGGQKEIEKMRKAVEEAGNNINAQSESLTQSFTEDLNKGLKSSHALRINKAGLAAQENMSQLNMDLHAYNDKDEEIFNVISNAIKDKSENVIGAYNKMESAAKKYYDFVQENNPSNEPPMLRTLRELSGIDRNDMEKRFLGSREFLGSDKQAISGMQARISQFGDEYARTIGRFDEELDWSSGKVNPQKAKEIFKDFNRLQSDLGKTSEYLIKDIGEKFPHSDADNTMKEKVREATAYFSENIAFMKDKLKEFSDEANNTKANTNDLFETFKKAGYFTAFGMLLNKTTAATLTTAEIQARDVTAFDLTSPVAMWNERKQFELYSETEQRKRDLGLLGTIVGGATGTFIGGPWGAVAGMSAGGAVGDFIAEYINKGVSAQRQEEMKSINQAYGKAAEYVNMLSGYDTKAVQAEARFGQDMRGSSGLGYNAIQEMDMKRAFGEALGRFYEPLYYEQSMFARAEGINPQDLYALNRSARITGGDMGIMGLDRAADMAKRTFGEDSDTKRIVDLLTAVKDTNMEMLRLDINADAREAIKFGNIPGDIFGVLNPYGRMGDLGGQTLNILEGLGRPQTEAHHAFLFQAYGTNDLMEFNERLKGGIYYKDNLEKIFDFSQKMGHGNERDIYFMLDEMMKDAPAGLLPRITELIKNGQIETDKYAVDEKGRNIFSDKEGNKIFKDESGKYFNDKNQEVKDERYIHSLKQDTEKVTVTISDLTAQVEGKTDEEARKVFESYKLAAENNKSAFEIAQEKIVNIQLSIAESYKEMILNSQTRMAEVEDIWLKSALTQDKISEMLKDSFGYLDKKLADMGIYLSGGSVNQHFLEQKYNAVYEINGHQKSKAGESIEDYINRTVPEDSAENLAGVATGGTGIYYKSDYREKLNKKLKEIDDQKSRVMENFYKSSVIQHEDDRIRKIIGGVDITDYATDPTHEEKIAILKTGMDIKNASDANKYIQRNAPGSPITGEMVFKAAEKHGIDPELLIAIMQQDSTMGTKGKGARTNNPGNIGNDDSGNTRKYGSWEEGIDATAQWLKDHEVKGLKRAAEDVVIPKNKRKGIYDDKYKDLRSRGIVDPEDILEKHKENERKADDLMERLYHKKGKDVSSIFENPERKIKPPINEPGTGYEFASNYSKTVDNNYREDKIGDLAKLLEEAIVLLRELVMDSAERRGQHPVVVEKREFTIPRDLQNS